jgi:asparagine synthase (glutamine-hydrolysing)
MCGIVAVISKDKNTNDLCRKMLSEIQHRGKDSVRVQTNEDKEASIGHCRLAINDLSEAGVQPFKYWDGLMWAWSVTNGEIWNHKEFNFKRNSNSDCEAILPCFMNDEMKKLDGMFSTIIMHNNCLHIYRDWVGKLPLYMVKEGKDVFICSEIKGLRAVTANENVKFIPKNSHIVIDTTSREIMLTEHNFFGWIGNCEHLKNDGDVAGNTYQLLDRAVRKRTISDVPIATLNSGGIDSSAITYLLSQYVKDIKCYTVKFDEDSPDLKHARLLADYLGIELIEVVVPKDAEKIKERFHLVNRAIEFPSSVQMQCGVMTSYLMEQISKDGHKVVFSGEGSDESAGSYARMQMFKNKPDWRDLKKAMFEKQYYGNLLRGNNIGMYFGTIEMRTPFFDRDYVEYVCNLPSSVTFGDKHQRKKHLADAFRGKIPDAILDRKKETFQAGTCFQNWFEELILKDPIVNKNGRKKMYHVIADGIKKELCYNINDSRKFKFNNRPTYIGDLFE